MALTERFCRKCGVSLGVVNGHTKFCEEHRLQSRRDRQNEYSRQEEVKKMRKVTVAAYKLTAGYARAKERYWGKLADKLEAEEKATREASVLESDSLL